MSGLGRCDVVTFASAFLLGSATVSGAVLAYRWARSGRKVEDKDASDATLDTIPEAAALCRRLAVMGAQPVARGNYPQNWIHCVSSTTERRVRSAATWFPEARRAVTIVAYGEDTQGPPDHVHGGCSASVVDAVCGLVAFRSTGPAMTVNLNVNYRNPVPVGSAVVVDAWLASQSGRKLDIRFRVLPIAAWTALLDTSGAALPPVPENLSPKSPEVHGYCQHGSALFVHLPGGMPQKTPATPGSPGAVSPITTAPPSAFATQAQAGAAAAPRS
eukprot:TRINITY_DN47732_c0_g1_i1.p1 TRINITY_DN47732_c0_g1~~TRINITY_DN47732_c0_g1_i1.p1  ORF type:complete len:273 (-),score=34.02 TRINITY_DN47732_c0_g1_i1:36-854(-)